MQYRDKKWLFNEYVNKKRSMREIAKDCGVSPSVILRWLRKNEIHQRTVSEGIKAKQPPEGFKPSLTYQDRDWLYDRYVKEEKTMGEIAKGCNVSRQTIAKYMKKYGISARTRHDYLYETERGKARLEKMHRDYIAKNPEPIQIVNGRIKNWKREGEKITWQNQFSQNEGQLQ